MKLVSCLNCSSVDNRCGFNERTEKLIQPIHVICKIQSSSSNGKANVTFAFPWL